MLFSSGASSKVVKLAVSAFLLAQFCILQAHASHYIMFKMVRKGENLYDRAGICIHDGKVLMADQDNFAISVNNYGFHKNGYSANVNWSNGNVDVYGWGRYKFQKYRKSGYTTQWSGCWDSSGGDCGMFQDQAEKDCRGALDVKWFQSSYFDKPPFVLE